MAAPASSLAYALAVEQHDRVFDLTGDDAAVGCALEPVRRLDDVLRHAFALAQHHAVGIGGVVVAGVRRTKEILRRFRVVRRLSVRAVERHDPEIVERARVVLGRRTLELRLGGDGILGDALRALKQQHSEFVGGLRIAKIAGEAVPAGGFAIVADHRRAVVVDLADQRHRRRVLGIGVKAPLSLEQSVEEIAALIGAEGQIRRHSIRPRRQGGRQ